VKVRYEIASLKDAPLGLRSLTLSSKTLVEILNARGVRVSGKRSVSFMTNALTDAARKGGWAVVARNGEEIIGWACVAPFAGVIGIGVFVRESYRHKGYGGELAKRAKACAHEKYPKKMTLVAPNDECGEKIFKRAGLM